MPGLLTKRVIRLVLYLALLYEFINGGGENTGKTPT